MAKLSRIEWAGLRKKLQSIAFGVTEVPVSIIEIPESEGELGYTSNGNSIHLSCTHPIMDDLPVKKKIAFITGVFAHELMHRIATNFKIFEKTLKSLKSSEARIFRDIFNVIEDPAIEEQARFYIGGHLLKCLHYSVMYLYKQSAPLKPTSAFAQFLSALIMYGDGGILKGEFTEPEAKNMFYKVLPTVDKAITEMDGKKRVELAYEVFLMSKPLWEEYAKNIEEMEKLMKDIEKAMKNAGKGEKGSSGGSPLDIEPDTDSQDPASERKQRRRKVTFRKVSKEEMEEARKNASSGSGDPGGDVEILYCDEDEGGANTKKGSESGSSGLPAGKTEGKGEDGKPQKSRSGRHEGAENEDKPGDDGGAGDSSSPDSEAEKDAEGGSKASGDPEDGEDPDSDSKSSSKSKSGDKSEETEEGTSEGSGGSESGEDGKDKPGSADESSSDGEDAGAGESDGEADKSSTSNEDTKEPSSDDAACGIFAGGVEPDYEKEATIDESEYELSEEDLSKIEKMIEEIRTEASAENTARTECHSDDLNTPELDVNYAGVRCLNKRITRSVSASLEAQYTEVVGMLIGSINLLYSQMKRIINNAASEREYRGTGRVSIPRLNCGRLTSRVFERNIDPADKDDMCVEILIDESGSMRGGRKSICAMQCAVGLTEVLARLRIPTKVIGFTADDGGYDVIHHHYMHWLNTPDERMNLLNIGHHWNNFDGYSIRYATEMIKKRRAKHKILVIISDGAPACFYYSKMGAGMADTMDAVKQAAKVADVIGVGVGSGNEQIWKALYGDHFIHVRNANDLLSRIGNEIQRIMKRWDE